MKKREFKNALATFFPTDMLKLVFSLDENQIRYIYQAQLFSYVYEDMIERIPDIIDTDTDTGAKIALFATRKYVLDADVDCNLSYWDNIDIFIKEGIEEAKREGALD